MTMTDIWMGTEHHGYQFFFSTRELAESWFERQVESQGGREAGEDYTVEEVTDVDVHYLCWDSEPVAQIDRFEVDVA